MARVTIEIDDGLYEVATYLAAQDGRSVESLIIALLLRNAQQQGVIEPAPPPRWQWRSGGLTRVAVSPGEATPAEPVVPAAHAQESSRQREK